MSARGRLSVVTFKVYNRLCFAGSNIANVADINRLVLLKLSNAINYFDQFHL